MHEKEKESETVRVLYTTHHIQITRNIDSKYWMLLTRKSFFSSTTIYY